MFITDTAKLSAAFSQDIRKSLDEGWKKITAQKQLFPMKYPSQEFTHPQPFPHLNNLLNHNRLGQGQNAKVKPENDQKKGITGSRPRRGSHNAGASTLQHGQSTRHNYPLANPQKTYLTTTARSSSGKRGSVRTTTEPFSKSDGKYSKNMTSCSKSRPMSAPLDSTPWLPDSTSLERLKWPSLSSISLQEILEQKDITITETESVLSNDSINASSSNFLAETDLVSSNPLLRNIKTNEAEVYSYLRERIENSNSNETVINETSNRDVLASAVGIDLLARGTSVLDNNIDSEPLDAEALARVTGRLVDILNRDLMSLHEENAALKSENLILRKQVHAINGLPMSHHSEAVEVLEKEELLKHKLNDKLMDKPTNFISVEKPLLSRFESIENRFNQNGPDNFKSDLNANNILNSKMSALELLVTILTQSLEKAIVVWEDRFSIHESRHERTLQRFEEIFAKIMTIKHLSLTKQESENNGNASPDKLDDEEKSLKSVKSELNLNNKKVQFKGILKP